MKSILNKFIGFYVTVAKSDGIGVSGYLMEFDTFGLTLLAEVESDHEVKEKVAVYIPHKNVDYVSAREDANSTFKNEVGYDVMFGGAVQ